MVHSSSPALMLFEMESVYVLESQWSSEPKSDTAVLMALLSNDGSGRLLMKPSWREPSNFMVIGAEHKSHDMSAPSVSAGKGWLVICCIGCPGVGPNGSEHVSFESKPPSASAQVQMDRSSLITSQNETGAAGEVAGEGGGHVTKLEEEAAEEEEAVEEDDDEPDDDEPSDDEDGHCAGSEIAEAEQSSLLQHAPISGHQYPFVELAHSAQVVYCGSVYEEAEPDVDEPVDDEPDVEPDDELEVYEMVVTPDEPEVYVVVVSPPDEDHVVVVVSPPEDEYSDALEACKAHSTPRSTERIVLSWRVRTGEGTDMS